MKNKHQQKRCMDCLELFGKGECYSCNTESQLACKNWKPAMTENQFKALMEEYPMKKYQKVFKSIYKYMK